MDGGRCAWRRAACVALALAAGCGSSAAPGSTDASDSSADATADASADAPVIAADGGDLCPLNPVCGVGFHAVTRIADCTYALPAAPPDPSNVGVYLVGDGGTTKIPRDQQDQEGWDYVDTTYASIRLYGSWCDMDRAGTLGTPKFVAGCPGICIP